MALVIDKARTALSDITCAMNAFVKDTGLLTFPRGFPIKQSIADPHVETWDTDGKATVPVAGVAQSNYPTANFSGFWIAKVAKAGQHSVARIPPPKSPAYPRPV